MSTWLHSVPSEGSTLVASGTSPTAWMTDADERNPVQHIAYVGVDNKIHECFYYLAGTENRWHFSTPSEGRVAVARETSPTSWWEGVRNAQHIVYVGIDFKIHECFYDLAGPNQWQFNTPSEGRTAVAPRTSPTSWYSAHDKAQHIAYVGTDFKIHECFYYLGGPNEWKFNTPSVGGPPVAPGTSPASWYTGKFAFDDDRNPHIVYSGSDNRVYHCQYWSFIYRPDLSAWRVTTLGKSAPPLAVGASPAATLPDVDGAHIVVYVGADHKVHEAVLAESLHNRWLFDRPSEGAAAAADTGVPVSATHFDDRDPIGFSAGIHHIAYVGSDRKLYDCRHSSQIPDFGGDWTVTVIGPTPVAANTSPVFWRATPDSSSHIAYVGADQKIHEVFKRYGI